MVFSRFGRFAPLTGVVFVVLLAVSFALGGSTPGVHASGAKVLASYAKNHSHRMASAYFFLLAMVFFLFFAGALRTFLRRVGVGGLAAVALVGAAVLAVGATIFAAMEWSLSDAYKTLTPAGAQALNVLSNDFFAPFALGMAVFGIAIGIALVLSRALPQWLGWIAIVLGILGLTPAAFFAFLALAVWTLIVSILVFTRFEARGVRAAPATA